MAEPQEWNKSTNWEIDFYDEIDEIVQARADLVAAIEAGDEPKDWPISGLDGTEWPREAIFPTSKRYVGKGEVRFND